MSNIDKITMTHEDAVPLVHASLVFNDAELLRAIQPEFVVIDGHFDNIHNTSPDLSSDSTHFSVASTAHNIDPPNSIWNHDSDHPQDHHQQCHPGEACTPRNVQYSKVDQSKTCGAWAAGIVLGFLVGAGPSLSMAFGIGAAYYSQQEECAAGDVARAIGDVALLSHKKFVEVNEKHNLIETVADGTVSFSRNCLVFVKRYVSAFFSTIDNKNRNPTRQMDTENAKTT